MSVPSKGDGAVTIGGLADAGGVGLGTVRYYQKIGLLFSPPKPKQGGFRRYSGKDVDRLRLIRNAQAFGFSLKEISRILHHHDQSDCHAIKVLITHRQHALRDQIRKLEDHLERLIDLTNSCDKACNGRKCDLLPNLSSDNLPFMTSDTHRN